MPIDHQVSESLLDILACKKCKLSQHTLPIPHIGDYSKEIMLIGEAPGELEEKFKEPFVGKSGKLLNLMLDSVGIDRSDCFITNVVKCRPKIKNNNKYYNRTPTFNEIEKCLPYLKEQIKILQPKIIITLGKVSFEAIYSFIKFKSIPFSKAQGITYKFKDIIILPLYHPAYILRNYSYKQIYQQSFLLLKPIIKALKIQTSRQKQEISKWL